MPMDETLFIYSGIINAATSLALGAFVFWKNPVSRLNRSFAYLALSVAFWATCYSLWLSSSYPAAALFLIRLTMSGSILISFLFTVFTFRLIERDGRWVNGGNLFLSLVWLGFIFTPHYISSVEKRLFFDFWPVPGIVFHFMLVHFIANTVYAHLLLWKSLKREQGIKTSQVRYVFFGTLIGFIGGSTNYFLFYNIPIPPYLNILVSVYILAVGYAIVRYRLMEIEVIIRRTVVFAGLFGFVFGVFSFGLFFAQEIVAVYFGFRWEAALAIGIFLIVLGYEPMREFLIRTTDRHLFQRRYNYQKLLKDASRGIAQIESLDYLLRLVVHFISMRVRIKNVAVLKRDIQTGAFYFGYQRGYPKGFDCREAFPLDEPLVRYLDYEKEALDIQRIEECIQKSGKKVGGGQAPSAKHDLLAIKKRMGSLYAACCVPSFLGKELRNILILGEKKSGDFYSDEDINLLFTLAQESAIAIENARLYDEAVNKSKELQRINEQLEHARARLVKALEETERANKELQNTQAQLIVEQKMATLGRLAASVGHEVNNPLTILSMNVSRSILKYKKDPDLKVADILDLFQKMEQNIGRIKAVVNTLTGLLKKSEKGKFEPLSLKLILEETLPLVQFQTYLENPGNIEVEFDVPSNLPLIRGDLERLQEVFLNLFINAYHAMAGRRNSKIIVRARVTEQDPRMVAIDFIDNGSGMSEEVQKKIFTYGFTTKGAGRGSGMGLYICRYIIELHGGEIRVKSRLGAGTTFTLTLPVYDEPSQAGVYDHSVHLRG